VGLRKSIFSLKTARLAFSFGLLDELTLPASTQNIHHVFGHFKTYTYIRLLINTYMTTKLTLTVEKDIIESAKVYAKQNGRSLSALIENYLKALVQKVDTDEDFSPKVKELMGSIKLPKDFDYKKELTEAISKKYAK
jgi:hypothetical protein